MPTNNRATASNNVVLGSGTRASSIASPVDTVFPVGATTVITWVKEKDESLKAPDEQPNTTSGLVLVGPALQSDVAVPNKPLPASAKAANAVVAPAVWVPPTLAFHP